MSLKFKQKATTIVQLCRNGQIVADIPCATSDDVEMAKAILLRYLSTLDSLEFYTLQQITLAEVRQSIL